MWATELWPLLPFRFTYFSCLAMLFYGCPAKYCGSVEAPKLVKDMFGRKSKYLNPAPQL